MCDAQMMPPIMGGSPGTVDKQVAASGDDGYVIVGTTFNNTGFYLYAGQSGASEYALFARWIGVSIEGTIDVSYMEVDYHGSSGAAELKVYGVDEDNPAAPTTLAEFAADPLTTAAVDWDGAWVSGWNQSPSLNAIFQELVNSYTISNDAVMVQVKKDAGTVYNSCNSYRLTGNIYGAKLHIEYTAAAAGASIPIIMHHRKMIGVS